MDERFLQAFFCRKHRVLGKPLQAFSLAHRLTLEAIDSPFLKLNEACTFSDLALAVTVCASDRPFEQLPWVRFGDQLRYRWSRLRPRYFENEAAKFVAYLEDCCAWPKLLESEEEPPQCYGLPWYLNIVAVLMRSGGVPEREAWTMPEGRAIWLYTALVRQEGAKLKVLSTDEENAMRAKFAEWEALENS